jgi:hypothetical protein
MKKIPLYYSFVITVLMVCLGFLGVKSLPELISAVFFAPLALYFGLAVLPRRSKAVVIIKPKTRSEKRVKIAPPEEAIEEKELPEEGNLELEEETEGGFDPQRRAFLKIIGSTGASLFLLSIFTKRAQAAFFGSVPGPGTVALKDTTGAQIDPAIKHPTDGYKISRVDDSIPAYYGYTDKDGNWFIMKEDEDGNYTYAVGTDSFTDNWDGKGGLDYKEYYEKF